MAITTFDAKKNFSSTTVVTTPTPTTSGTTLIVFDGTVFPAFPFNIAIYPSTSVPTPTNAEICRVTALSGNTLTIVRMQEASVARAIITGDIVALVPTKKTMTDIETAINTLESGAGTSDQNIIGNQVFS